MANFYASYPFEAGSGGGGGSGTVTSVGLLDASTVPIYTITGSPVTTSGTLTFTLATELANTVFAGPNGGPAAQPSFRALVAADLPFAIGNLTDSGTDGLVVTGGTGAVIGSGTSISQHVADSTHNGYLSSVDWIAFNAKQAAGNYITALTGDVTASGPGSAAATLATVNANVGSFGSSTAIPSFTVNGKGLVTAASTNVVIAPAGTLTGTTLASNVITSSLTTVGTIGTGVWQGTAIAIGFGGTGQTTANAAFAALSPMTTAGDIIYENATPLPTRLGIGGTGQILTVVAGLPSWQNATAGFANPMTTLGDIIYENASPAPTRLAGNTTATKNFLSQTGNGTISAAPSWSTIAAGDLPTGNLTDAGTDGIVVTGGTGSVIGSGTSLAQHVADTTHNGYLSSTDWNTFNGKQAALTIGNLTDAGTDGITVTGGTGAVIGTGTSLSQQKADTTHNGYLSSTDWTTFNGKQAAGNYITALTGDVTATGPGSVAATLATVNANVGTFGSSTSIPTFTVNGKGLITAASGNVVIAPAGTLTGTTLASNVVTSSLTTVGTIGTGVWQGTAVAIGFGGTGQATANAAFAALSPMTTLGDIIYENATPLPARLAGNTTTTKNFLSQTGNGTISAVPAWSTISAGDLPTGNLTDAGTDGIVVTGGAGAVVGSGTSLAQHVADTTHNGYLSSTDWNTFNGKQAAGNYITALTGDITASGPGSAAATLATVNANVGSFGSSTAIPNFTVNGKGLITAAGTNAVIAPAGTLTGTTLASNVVTSSLTAIGQTTAATTITGGVNVTTRTITGNLTIDTTTKDFVIFCNQSGAITVTLPAPTNGRYLVIKDISGNAFTNNITLARNGSESIEGLAASRTLATNWGSWSIFSNGTDWWIL